MANNSELSERSAWRWIFTNRQGVISCKTCFSATFLWELKGLSRPVMGYLYLYNISKCACTYLTFMGPCIVNIFQYIYPTRCNFKQFIYIWKLLYMFRVVLPPIIRSAYNWMYSIWYLSHRYCNLPLRTENCEAINTMLLHYRDMWLHVATGLLLTTRTHTSDKTSSGKIIRNINNTFLTLKSPN